jgi:hypothetical protein
VEERKRALRVGICNLRLDQCRLDKIQRWSTSPDPEKHRKLLLLWYTYLQNATEWASIGLPSHTLPSLVSFVAEQYEPDILSTSVSSACREILSDVGKRKLPAADADFRRGVYKFIQRVYSGS